MKTDIEGSIFHLTKYVLFFFIILVLSCTSTSNMRLEGGDFKDNLPGRWDGKWTYLGYSGPERIKISEIDGNKVHLTGFQDFAAFAGSSDEVYGRIENSGLVLTSAIWLKPPLSDASAVVPDNPFCPIAIQTDQYVSLQKIFQPVLYHPDFFCSNCVRLFVLLDCDHLTCGSRDGAMTVVRFFLLRMNWIFEISEHIPAPPSQVF